MNQNKKLDVLIVGAATQLGSLITKYCLTKPNLLVHIFDKDPYKAAEFASQVEKAGGKVINGDLAEPETFKGVPKNMHTVVFVLPNFDVKVSLDSHIAMIEECIANGVQRVVPSDYAENFYAFGKGELDWFPPIVAKLKVHEYLKTIEGRIKILRIHPGMSLDMLIPTVEGKQFEYWGKLGQKLQIGTYDDAAKITAAAVAKEDRSGEVTVIGNDITMEEVVEAYNRVKGTNHKAKLMGSLDDLKEKCEELEKAGSQEAFVMRLFTFVFDQRLRFDNVDNEEFKEVKMMTVEDYVRRSQDTNVFVQQLMDSDKKQER